MGKDLRSPNESSQLIYDFSTRELRLLSFYLDPASPAYHHGMQAAELAGFTGTRASLATQASRTIAKAKKCAPLAVTLREHGCTLEAVFERLNACLHARRTLVSVTQNGSVIREDIGDDYKVQMETAKLLLQLHGTFDSGYQEEVLLAKVAEAETLAEQEQVADETVKSACDNGGSDQAVPENQIEGENNSQASHAREHFEGCSESGSAGTTPSRDTTSILRKMADANDVAGQIDLNAVFAQLLLDAVDELKRTGNRGSGDSPYQSRLRADICKIAIIMHKLQTKSSVNEDFDEGVLTSTARAIPDAVAEAVAKLPPAEYYLTRDLMELLSKHFDLNPRVDDHTASRSSPDQGEQHNENRF